MSNNLKPWFRDDIARAMMSIYFSSVMSASGDQNNDYRKGFVAALSSVAIVIGINPESILQKTDVQLLQDHS